MNKSLSSKEIFLQNSLAENEKPAIYSLEEEFVKTKRNRDLKPQLIFFGFIFLLIGLTLGTVRYLDYKSRQINIGISDFEDLRLKEALNEATGKKEELNRKNEELSIKDKELKKLQSSYRIEVQRLKEKVRQSALKDKERSEEMQKGNDDKTIVQLREANSKLEVYQYALSMLLKEKKAAGCVIDPRRRRNILIFINPKVSSEIVVDLYRVDDIYVGKLKLVPDKNGVRAETVEVAKGQRIQPLDWFRI